MEKELKVAQKYLWKEFLWRTLRYPTKRVGGWTQSTVERMAINYGVWGGDWCLPSSYCEYCSKNLPFCTLLYSQDIFVKWVLLFPSYGAKSQHSERVIYTRFHSFWVVMPDRDSAPGALAVTTVLTLQPSTSSYPSLHSLHLPPLLIPSLLLPSVYLVPPCPCLSYSPGCCRFGGQL